MCNRMLRLSLNIRRAVRQVQAEPHLVQTRKPLCKSDSERNCKSEPSFRPRFCERNSIHPQSPNFCTGEKGNRQPLDHTKTLISAFQICTVSHNFSIKSFFSETSFWDEIEWGLINRQADDFYPCVSVRLLVRVYGPWCVMHMHVARTGGGAQVNALHPDYSARRPSHLQVSRDQWSIMPATLFVLVDSASN